VQIFSPSFGPGPLQACKNFIVDLPGPASDQPEKLIILTARYDKIGVGSDGFYDNAVSCAALVDLAGQFQNDLPPGTRVQIVFLDAEEQGLMGSRAFVKSLQIDKVTPDLIVNLDLMGGSGKEVYVGASNSSHAGWPFAEDRASARAPKRTQKNEAHFINLLRQEAQDFNIVQNSGTPYSDHLAAQFEGLQAIGISVVKPGEPQQTELYENAFTEFAAANVDWAVIDRIHNNTDEGAPEYKYASQRLQAANLRWIDAMSALQHASDNYGTGKRLHNDQDNEDLFHSGNANQFSRILKTVVDRFLAPAAV
jgi:Zn-dependent M28 family amino/carboxypeptidase